MPVEQSALKPGDFLPYLMIIFAALMLLVFPLVPGIKLYQWLQNRQLWWAVLILMIGAGGIASMIKTRSISPYHVSLAVLMTLAVSLAGFFS